MKSNIAHFDEQIKDTIGSITNNLAFTTGQRVNLEWHQSNDGHNVYMDGRIDGRNAVLPFPSHSRRELFVGLRSYNKALEDVYKLRKWDNKFWIKENDDENSNSC